MAWRRTPPTGPSWRKGVIAFVAIALSLFGRRVVLDEDVGFWVDLGVAFLIMMAVLGIAFATGFIRPGWERAPD